jgi:hypothetical protein
MNILQQHGKLYLSTNLLKIYAPSNTIKKWKSRFPESWITIDGVAYFDHQSIPKGKAKSDIGKADKIISRERKKNIHSKVADLLHDAFYFKYTQYKSFYEQESKFHTAKVTEFSKLHAVLQTIIDLKKNEGCRDLKIIYDAFNNLLPNKYKSKHALSNAVRKASADGIVSVALDKRTFGNNDRDKKEDTPQIDYVMSVLVSCNGKFSCKEILEKCNAHFKANKLKEFGLSWVKKQRADWLKNTEVYKNRYGQNKLTRIMPYATLKGSTYIHTQWQIDGFTLPFWEAKFHRSTFVFVIDNCSKKIIAYWVGNSEDSELIKTTLRIAVFNTGVLPNEVVMDNHAFTKTQAAFNFESLLEKLGARLTKTSNPRAKIYVERYIQYLNSHFKKYTGYLGQSIRSKSIEAIASDELRAEYAKNFKTQSQVVAMCVSVVEAYNNEPQKGKTPNQVYDENPHPHPIVLSQYHKAEMLPNQQLKQIRNGQITIMRGVEKFEYQLSADLFHNWNNQTVIITYQDLNDGIYLFDQLTGNGVAHLHIKQKINNAKALQTPEDVQGLYNNKGRISGIIAKDRKQLELVRDKVLNIHPDTYEQVNALTTPKGVKKELEQSGNLKMLVETTGVITSELPEDGQRFDLPVSLKPQKKERNPFTVKNNIIEIYKPLNNINDD